MREDDDSRSVKDDSALCDTSTASIASVSSKSYKCDTKESKSGNQHKESKSSLNRNVNKCVNKKVQKEKKKKHEKTCDKDNHCKVSPIKSANKHVNCKLMETSKAEVPTAIKASSETVSENSLCKLSRVLNFSGC